MRYIKPDLRIRLPKKGEDGTPFIKWLHENAGRDRAKRLAIFLQQWDHLSDDLQAPPTPKQYAEEWQEPLSSTYKLLEEFREVFPTESDPERVVKLIWDGMPRNDEGGGMEFMSWLDVKVADND